MKTLFYSFLVFVINIPFNINAQEYNRVYYNSNWVVTSIDKATFYRISSFNPELRSYDDKVTDYYIKNNQIEMVGFYKNGKKNGEFTFYYPNGKVKMKINYNNDERVGEWAEFFSNGRISKKLFYVNNTEKLIELNDSLGYSLLENNKINYTYYLKDFPEDPLDFDDDKGEKFEISGCLLDNLREGKWVVNKKRDLFAKMNYKNGVIIKGYCMTKNINGKYIESRINNNIIFPFIIEPIKFYVTENYFFEPKAVIKTNYLIKGLYQSKNKTKEKVKFSNFDDLVYYIQENFNIKSSAYNKFIITLSIKNGIIERFSTTPKLSEEVTKYLESIINTIDKIEFTTENNLVIEYSVGSN